MVTKIQIAGKLKFYSKPYGRQWKWRYQTHGRMVNPKLRVPDDMKNLEIIDPLEDKQAVLAREQPNTIQKPAPAKWIPPRRHPLLESFFPQAKLADHPNYHSQPIKLFDRSVRFHAGVDQACLLSKAQPFPTLPEQMSTQKVKLDSMGPHVGQVIRDSLRQALAFTPNKQECKGFKVPNDPKINVANEWATPRHTQMRIILDNLLRLADMNLIRNSMSAPSMIGQRTRVENSAFESIIQRGSGQDTEYYQVRNCNDYAIISGTKPKPVASESQVEATRKFKFVDMYPIFPTIDLKETNVYDNENLGRGGLSAFADPIYKGKSDNQFVDTILHVNDDNLPRQQEVGRLIMFAFAQAHAQAKLLKENNALEMLEEEVIKEPLVVKAVSLTNDRLHFVVFQLNSLDLTSNQGVKNMVFYDDGVHNENENKNENLLYLNRPVKDRIPYASHKNVQRMALSHLIYNPNVYEKFFSLITHGF